MAAFRDIGLGRKAEVVLVDGGWEAAVYHSLILVYHLGELIAVACRMGNGSAYISYVTMGRGGASHASFAPAPVLSSVVTATELEQSNNVIKRGEK